MIRLLAQRIKHNRATGLCVKTAIVVRWRYLTTMKQDMHDTSPFFEMTCCTCRQMHFHGLLRWRPLNPHPVYVGRRQPSWLPLKISTLSNEGQCIYPCMHHADMQTGARANCDVYALDKFNEYLIDGSPPHGTRVIDDDNSFTNWSRLAASKSTITVTTVRFEATSTSRPSFFQPPPLSVRTTPERPTKDAPGRRPALPLERPTDRPTERLHLCLWSHPSHQCIHATMTTTKMTATISHHRYNVNGSRWLVEHSVTDICLRASTSPGPRPSSCYAVNGSPVGGR